MNKPTIIITGANGFIGQELVKYFLDKNWNVKAFVRSIPENKLKGVVYIAYNLTERPDENAFKSVDFLVHCAYLRYEQNKDADTINLIGTKTLIDLCRKNNVKPLFLSSFSAHEKAQSHYGKTKLATEKLFNLSKEVVLKPGFVIGKKGMASELINTIRKSRFFPLIGGGIQPIQTIYIEDLCLIVENCFLKKLSGLFYVAESEAITMKNFYKEISKQLDKKTIFIPFSLPLVYHLCSLTERMGLKLPVYSESVVGLKNLVSFETQKDLEKIGIPLKNYCESLESVLK